MKYFVWLPTALLCAICIATLALSIGTEAPFAGTFAEQVTLLSIFVAIPAAAIASAKWTMSALSDGGGLTLRALFRRRPADPRRAHSWLWGRLMLVFFAYAGLAMFALAIFLAVHGGN